MIPSPHREGPGSGKEPNRAASAFDRIETFGLIVLLAGLPLSEALKSVGLALSVLGFIGKAASGVRPSVGHRAPALALLVLFVVAGLSIAFAEEHLRQPGELVTLAMTTAPFVLVADVCRGSRRRLLLSLVVIAGCAVAAAEGLIDFLTGGAHRLGLGSVENPVPAAEYLGACLVLAVGLLVGNLGPRVRAALVAAAGPLFAVTLLLTRSRGPMIGTAAGAVLVLAAGRRRKVFAALLLLLIVASAVWFSAANPESRMSGPALTDSRSASFRFHAWREASRLFAERPVLGHGFGSFAELGVVYEDDAWKRGVENAHSTWLHAACETGLLGAGALTAFLVLAMAAIVRGMDPGGGVQAAVSLGTLGAVAALTVAGIFSVTVDAEPGMLLFALVALGQRPRPAGDSHTTGGR
jgi:O-antigen ligase